MDNSTREIRVQIEKTRSELGDTVEALAQTAATQTHPKQVVKSAVRRPDARIAAGVFAAAALIGVALIFRNRN